MYDLKTIEECLELLEQYQFKYSKVSRLTGIKITTIRSWRNKQIKGEPLLTRPFVYCRNKKWSADEIKKVVDFYFEHGKSITSTVRKFGYPSVSSLKNRVKNDERYEKKNRIINQNRNNYSSEDKIHILKSFCTKNVSTKEKTKELGVTNTTIYNWHKKLTGEGMKKEETKTIEELLGEIEKLRKEHAELELENKILKKANEELKKEIGANYEYLSNKEKTIVVSALSKEYKISELLSVINLKKSTYYYEKKLIDYEKYADIKQKITDIFNNNYRCYGYRRIKAALRFFYNINISEKVVRRLMKELDLVVYKKKTRKFSSYKGEISPENPNLLNRDFKASKPHEKLLTDITEFALKDGKVYLSPLIDCYDGKPITYTIGMAPTSDLTNTMLIKAHEIIKDNNCIIHSDRGFHYRLKSWIDLMNDFGYTQSMSKKGCTADNSMCEGFFGTIKNEFFYPNDWRDITCEEFMLMLDDFLQWFTNDRIKLKLLERV